MAQETRFGRSATELIAPSSLAPYVTATVHPSSILRAPDAVARALQTRAFVRDLKTVSGVLEKND
jgi:uracil-DNA glycosylase